MEIKLGSLRVRKSVSKTPIFRTFRLPVYRLVYSYIILPFLVIYREDDLPFCGILERQFYLQLLYRFGGR